MSEYRTCKAGDKCHWPRGPVQPIHHFTKTFYDTTFTYEYCVSCRAHQVRQVMEGRAKRAAGNAPNRTPRPARKKHNNLPSNADITPEHRQALDRWLMGLVVRREQ